MQVEHPSWDIGFSLETLSSIPQPEVFDDCFLPSNQTETELDLTTAENPPDSGLIRRFQPSILPGLDTLAIPAELKFILEYRMVIALVKSEI